MTENDGKKNCQVKYRAITNQCIERDMLMVGIIPLDMATRKEDKVYHMKKSRINLHIHKCLMGEKITWHGQ